MRNFRNYILRDNTQKIKPLSVFFILFHFLWSDALGGETGLPAQNERERVWPAFVGPDQFFFKTSAKRSK